jgi:hypothetical protein
MTTYISRIVFADVNVRRPARHCGMRSHFGFSPANVPPHRNTTVITGFLLTYVGASGLNGIGIDIGLWLM